MKLPSLRLSRSKKPSGQKKAVKKVSIPAAPRFSLLIGDEGAILTYTEKHTIQKRYYAANSSEEHIREFNSVVAANPAVPIDVFLDTIDQTYLQQTLPPVSSFSTGKLMKRRLTREFPDTPLKGSLLLEREKGDRKDWNFLMVAVDPPETVRQWLQWVEQLPNRCRGFYLLPIESESLLRSLQQDAEDAKAHPWSFIITHNKVSGFRQMVFHQGRMIFTRLGQPLNDNDNDIDVVAGAIEQEILSTIEYLKRLSLKDTRAIKLYVIASKDVLHAIDRMKLNVGAITLLSPHELALALGFENSSQPTDRFGDVVITTALSAHGKRKLRFQTPMLTKLEQLYQMFLFLRSGAALTGLALLYLIGSYAYDYWSLSQEISRLEEDKKVKQAAYEQTRADSAKLTDDIDKLSDTVSVYDALQQEAYTPLPFLQLLSKTLPEDVTVNSVEWKLSEDGKAAAGGAAAPAPSPVSSPAGLPSAAPAAAATAVKLALGNAPVEGKISLVFMNIDNSPTKLKERSESLMTQLKTAFPGYEFQYSSLQGVAKETDRVEIVLGSEGSAQAQISTAADITYKGRAILDAAQKQQKAAP